MYHGTEKTQQGNKYCKILPANGRHLRFQFLELEIFNITPWQSLKIDTKILKALEHCMLMHLSNLCSSVGMKISESNDFFTRQFFLDCFSINYCLNCRRNVQLRCVLQLSISLVNNDFFMNLKF